MKKILLTLFLNYHFCCASQVAKICEEMDFAYDKGRISVFGLYKNHKTIIHFIRDAAGKKFVVKQMIKPDIFKQLCIIHEALASYVAESIGIPINKVRLISPQLAEFEKPFPSRLASLHSYASGVHVNQPGPFAYLWIKQKCDASIPKSKWGITYEVIQRLRLHRDLPKIAAFDTFIGNRDRAPHNLFYCPKKHQFCGIDHEISFLINLPNLAITQIEHIRKKNRYLSKSELFGLKCYKNTLKQLIKKNPPIEVIKKLEKLFQEAGFDPQVSAEGKKYFNVHKVSILELYESSKKLVKLLDQFLEERSEKIKK